MKIYLANLDPRYLPQRALRLFTNQGHVLAGNWLDLHNEKLDDFKPDLMLYVHHRRREALTITKDDVERVPCVSWALYPDQMTGWDVERNAFMEQMIEPLPVLLPRFRLNLANSLFTKNLLEERAPGIQVDVCYLGIDTEAIASAGAQSAGTRPASVLWQQRWSSDKNLDGALALVRRLAARHPGVAFYIGRNQDWQPREYVTEDLQKQYAAISRDLDALDNVFLVDPFHDQNDYRRFIARMDVGFSCAYHESFGLALLEQAYAGAACVAPEWGAYPEIHSGALIVPPDEVEQGVERLLGDPDLWARVARSSRENAARYDVACTARTLLSFLEQAAG